MYGGSRTPIDAGPNNLNCTLLTSVNVPANLNLVSGVAIDSTNNVYVVGISRSSGMAALYRSADGVSWSMLDSLSAVTYGSNLGASALPRVTVDGCDGVHWTVQEPRDGGTNWVILSREASNHVTRVSGGTWPSNVTVGADGTLFAGGAFGSDAGVVRSRDRGASWSEVSNVTIALATEPTAVAVTSDGVVLNNVTGDGPMSWTVVASISDGGPWQSTTQPLHMPGKSGGAAVSPAGARFVSGVHWASGEAWEIQANFGSGWGTVDSIGECAASGMFSNHLGVFALGNCSDGGAMMRASPTGTSSTWRSVTEADGHSDRAYFATAADLTGRLFVVGAAGDAGLILRATCTN